MVPNSFTPADTGTKPSTGGLRGFLPGRKVANRLIQNVSIRNPAPKMSRRDVYVFFDNDAKVRAPDDAQNLPAASTNCWVIVRYGRISDVARIVARQRDP